MIRISKNFVKISSPNGTITDLNACPLLPSRYGAERKRGGRGRGAEHSDRISRSVLSCHGAGLEAARIKPRELGQRKGSDPCKIALAKLLWEQTTAS
jgi:hypothetical protein